MKHAPRLLWLVLLGVSGLTWAAPDFQLVILDRSYIAYERDVGDIDGDEDDAVVAVQEGDTDLQVFHAPDWTRSTLVTFTGSFRYPRADDHKLGDIDNDSDLDIVGIRNWNSAPSWIYRNTARDGRSNPSRSDPLPLGRSESEGSAASDRWEELTVDVGQVLSTTRHRPLGINLDYLIRPTGAEPMQW